MKMLCKCKCQWSDQCEVTQIHVAKAVVDENKNRLAQMQADDRARWVVCSLYMYAGGITVLAVQTGAPPTSHVQVHWCTSYVECQR